MRSMRYFCMLSLATIAFVICGLDGVASAYVGPGPGLTVLGALWAVIAALLLAFLAIVRWPLRYLLRKLRGRGSGVSSGDKGPAQKADADKPEVAGSGDEG